VHTLINIYIVMWDHVIHTIDFNIPFIETSTG
jgi:hypothetical protein